MNFRHGSLLPALLFAQLLAPLARAQQVPPARDTTARFDTPAQAARAFAEAATLQARADLLRPVAVAYLRAHACDKLPALIASLPLAEDAAWQRAFLLADLDVLLGNLDEAARLLGRLPEAGLRDPVVRKFRAEQPGLFGDDPLRPPPDVDSEPPDERIDGYLRALEPDKAWEVIAAHPDVFLDDPGVWRRFAPQFIDQNLASRLLPLLAERAKRHPDDWDGQLMQAVFQLAVGDNPSATESFRRVRDRQPDDPTLSPTPAERVAAMERITLSSARHPDQSSPFPRIRTVENARDFALICLAGLADERHEGPGFIRALGDELRGNPTEWIAALMLINSPGLVVRELEASLAKGPPSDLAALAGPWLKKNHPDRMGVDWSQSRRERLAEAFAQRQPAGTTAPSSPAPDSAWRAQINRAAEVLKSDDPAVREKYLAELAATINPGSGRNLFTMFLSRAVARPDDHFALRAAAVLLARAVEETDGWIALRALDRSSRWSPSRSPFPGGFDRNGFRPRRGPGSDGPSQPPAIDEQVESAFLAQSAMPWGLFHPLPSRPPQPPQTFPPGLALALDELARDDASPLRYSARIAEASVLYDTAGQQDRALDLLRQSIKESPSYTARFWLTAFLARRQQYGEAAEVFNGIESIPGNFAAFLQDGRRLLERAQTGKPLFGDDGPATARNGWPEPAKRATTTGELINELRRLTGRNSNDPTAASQALAIAAKLSAIFPAEAVFPDREAVLRALAKFGGLDQEIRRIEARAKEFSGSPDAQLALGQARSLSADPATVAASATAFREAFRLAPDRADIAVKILGPGFSPGEIVDAYCAFLRHGGNLFNDLRPDVSSLPHDPDSQARYARAYGEGFGPYSHAQFAGSPSLRQWVESLRKAGQDEAAIDMLTAIDRASPSQNAFDAEPQESLVKLLEEKGRAAEIAPILDRMLFPSETLYGLDLSGGQPMPLLSPPGALDFLQKSRTPERTAALEDRARRIMAERPGDTRAPLVLLTLLALDRDPALAAALPGCLETLRANHDNSTASELSALAQMASTSPATQGVSLGLLAEVNRWRTGNPTNIETLGRFAATALDLGEPERAKEALREILAVARSHKRGLFLPEWTANLDLMARCGMDPEAAELCALACAPSGPRPTNDRHSTAAFVLTYMEACVRYGRTEAGRATIENFLRRLTEDLAEGNPETYRYEFNRKFFNRLVEAFVALNAPVEASKALWVVGESRLAAAVPEVRQFVEAAQGMLARGTGERGALPVAFAATGDGNTLWWDVSALGVGDRSLPLPRVSLFGTDLPGLKGRYFVEILGGDAPDRLTTLAVIPAAHSRGTWHGAATVTPGTIRFTRVVLMDAGGASVAGPTLPVTPGEERIEDPDLGEAIKTGGSTTQWTLPEGVLSTAPGPVPDRPGLSFVYKSIQPACEIRGRRVPVRPGEAFVQSAWMRGGWGCSWGRRYYDTQGKELEAVNNSTLQGPDDAAGWTLVEQRLQSAPDKPASGQVRVGEEIPAGTAFIEPVLRFSYGVISWDAKAPVRWAGLSLRSVPQVTENQNPRGRRRRDLDELDLAEKPAAEPDKTPRNEKVFAKFGSAACKVAVSPESDLVVVGCTDGTLHFLKYPSGEEMGSVHAHDDPITEIAVLPGGTGVYSVDKRGDAHFVSLDPARDDLVACTAHRPSAAVVSRDQKWIIYASDMTRDTPSQDKVRIEVVDLASGKPVRMFETPGLFNELSLSADEKQFSLRQPVAHGEYLVRTWELPMFHPLPDRADHVGRGWTGGTLMRPLFVLDPSRKRYVMVEETGRFAVRSLDHEILWTFDPAQGALSLAVAARDGAILLCKGDGKVWRCKSPK